MKLSADMEKAKDLTLKTLKKNNEIMPMFLLFDGTKNIPSIFMVPWTSDQEKDKFTQELGPLLMAHYKTKKFIFIAESFLTKFSTENSEAPPIKLDAIVVLSSSLKQKELLTMIIEKDKKDKWKVIEENATKCKPDECDGAITDILVKADKMRSLFTEEEIKKKHDGYSMIFKKHQDFKREYL